MNAAEFEAVVVTAKRAAESERTRWLATVNDGLVTVTDVIEEACTPDGRPLLALTLRKLLAHQPGWGDGRAMRTINRMCGLLAISPQNQRRLTIAWLVDSRTGGHRIQAWCDVLTEKSGPPWSGFPYSPEPKGGSAYVGHS